MSGKSGQQDLCWTIWYAQFVGHFSCGQRLRLKQLEDLEFMGSQQGKAAKVGIQNFQDRILIGRRFHVPPFLSVPATFWTERGSKKTKRRPSSWNRLLHQAVVLMNVKTS